MHLNRRQALLLTAAQITLAGATARIAFAEDTVGKLETVENEVWGTPVGATRIAMAEAAAVSAWKPAKKAQPAYASSTPQSSPSARTPAPSSTSTSLRVRRAVPSPR
jgi:hypothetical protein